AFAEVTVVFDNTSGRLPVDYAEVAISRRVERDGESDYFLNGTRVRRRDLLHLLSSTGLTLDSYAIIDQRDIESIVVCTPGERRPRPRRTAALPDSAGWASCGCGFRTQSTRGSLRLRVRRTIAPSRQRCGRRRQRTRHERPRPGPCSVSWSWSSNRPRPHSRTCP